MNHSPILDEICTTSLINSDHSNSNATTNNTSRLSLASRLRVNVLLGGFLKHLHMKAQWQAHRFKLLLFVSSTFTDTHRERNVLLESILSDMKALGSQHDIEITFVDMRWGVRDESTIDHKTWEECFMELKRCYEESIGLFFFSLQADKYGYTPLPRMIDQLALDTRLKTLDVELVSLIQSWYHLDHNAIPPKYVLRNLSSINDSEYWGFALPTIRKALEGIVFDAQLWPNLVIGQSVTHWEAMTALETFDHSFGNCIWSHRSFAGTFTNEIDDPGQLLSDCTTPDRQARLRELKEKMHEYLDDDEFTEDKTSRGESLSHIHTVINYDTVTMQSYNAADKDWEDYLRRWERDTRHRLNAALQNIVKMRAQWDAYGSGLGVPGKLLGEMLHHCEWAAEKCSKFMGRNDIINVGLETLALGHRFDLSDTTAELPAFAGIAFALIGESGSGKTSLIAKLAASAFEAEEKKPNVADRRPVVVRFCGTSVGSANGLGLVLSICSQIRKLRMSDTSSCPLTIELEMLSAEKQHVHDDAAYSRAVKLLHYLLARYPVLLFIDSIDQLSNDYLARSRISFLDGVRPHEDTRIVVSALSDERDPETGKWMYCYGCEMRLRESHVPIIYIPALSNAQDTKLPSEPMSTEFRSLEKVSSSTVLTPQSLKRFWCESLTTSSEFYSMFTALLERHGRRLTPTQCNQVLRSARVEPTALYANLAAMLAVTWKSCDENVRLAPTVRGLVHQIFDDVERHYGTLLTRTALGLITFSVSGLTNNEIEDLLSLDEDVLTSVFQYATPGIRRIPSHVWLRLRGGLQGMLVQRTGGCLAWYHRQLIETAQSRYSESEIRHFHELMGQYFCDLVDPKVTTERRISRQPLTYSGQNIFFLVAGAKSQRLMINHRRAVEGLSHLLAAELYEDVYKQIMQPEVIFSAIYCEVAFTLVSKLHNALSVLKGSGKKSHIYSLLGHYLKWLQLDITAMTENPGQMIFASATENQLLKSPARQAILQYHRKTRDLSRGNLHFTNSSWTRQIVISYAAANPSYRNDLEARMATLRGHVSTAFGIHWSKSGQMLASGSKDKSIIIWGSGGGQPISKFLGHTDEIRSLAFSPDDSMLASCSGDCTVRVWDVQTGIQLQELLGHTAKIFCVCWSPDGQFLLSCSRDKTCRVWNVERKQQEQTDCIVLGDHQESVVHASWSSSGMFIATTAISERPRIWSAKSFEVLTILEYKKMFATVLVWLHFEDILVTGGVDNIIRVYHRPDPLENSIWSEKLAMQCPSLSNMNGLAISNDDYYVVACSYCGKIIVHDLRIGEVVYFILGFETINNVCWNPRNNVVACSLQSGQIYLFDLDHALTESTDRGTEHTLTRRRSSRRSIGSAAENQSLSFPEEVSETLPKQKRITCMSPIDGDGAVFTAQYSASGDKLVVGYYNGAVIVWDILLQVKLFRVKLFDVPVLYVWWATESTRVVASSSEDTFIVISAVDGSIITSYSTSGKRNWMRSLEVADSDRIFYATEDCKLSIFDLTPQGELVEIEPFISERTIFFLRGHGPTQYFAFSTAGGDSNAGQFIHLYRMDPKQEIVDSSTSSGIRWTLLAKLVGHTRQIKVFEFSHSGERLASGGIDEVVLLWSLPDGQLLYSLRSHNNLIIGICWSDDDKAVVSGDRDGICHKWDASDGRNIGTFSSFCRGAHSVLWRPGAEEIALCMIDGTVMFWELNTFKAIGILQTKLDYALTVDVSSCGEWVCAGYGDRNLRLFRVANLRCIAELPLSSEVTVTRFRCDAKQLIASEMSGAVHLWDIARPSNPVLLATWTCHSALVKSLSWSSSGRYFASGGYDGRIVIYSSDSREIIYNIRPHNKWSTALSWSPCESMVATCSNEPTCHIRRLSWSTTEQVGSDVVHSNGATKRLLGSSILVSLVGHERSVLSIDWNLTGSKLVTASLDATCRIWDSSTGVQEAVFRSNSLGFLSVVWSKEGLERIIAACIDTTIRIWSALDGSLVAELLGHQSAVSNVVVSPCIPCRRRGSLSAPNITEAEMEAISSQNSDVSEKMVQGIDSTAKLELTVISHHQDIDGFIIVSSSIDGSIRIWDSIAAPAE